MEYQLSREKQGIFDGLGNREVMTKLSYQDFFFSNCALLTGDIIFSVATFLCHDLLSVAPSFGLIKDNFSFNCL